MTCTSLYAKSGLVASTHALLSVDLNQNNMTDSVCTHVEVADDVLSSSWQKEPVDMSADTRDKV